MLKNLFLLIFVFLLVMPCMPQTFNVSGHVYLHDRQQPLFYSTITNLTGQHVAYSDEKGYFEIPAAINDTIVVSYIGCADKKVAVNSANVGDVFLEYDCTSLNEVDVVSRRRPLMMSAEGLSVNMSAVKKDGKLLTDVLRQLPTLKIQGTALSMAGKNGVIVYINNHRVNMQGGDLMAYLNSLGLDNIQKIDIISNPPAKYEAEGNVGILKIVTSKKINPGWQGRLLVKPQLAHYFTGGVSAKIIYSGKNFYIGNTVLGSYENNYVLSRYTNNFNGYLVSTDYPRQNRQKTVLTLTTFNVEINSKNALSGTLQLPWLSRGRKRDIANDTKYGMKSTFDVYNDSVVSSKGTGREKNYLVSGELNYEHSFDENSEFNLTAGYINNYAGNYRKWKSVTSNSYVDDLNDYYSLGHYKYDIYTLKADFDRELDAWSFTGGYKLSYTRSSSENDKSSSLNAGYASNDRFGYRELVNALYVNGAAGFGAFTVNAGVRAEATATKCLSYSLDETDRNHYFKFFPSLNVKYAFDDDNTLSAELSRRIKRPDYRLLNPFRWYTSKYDYSVGDPFLKPAYIGNAALTYMHGYDFFVKIYCSKTSDDFGNMVILDRDNVQNQIEKAGNYLDISEYGLDAECSLQCGSWLETTLSGQLIYSSYNSNSSSFDNVKGWGCGLSADCRFYISRNLTATLSVEDDLPGYYDYRRRNNAFNFNCGISFMNKKKDFMVMVNAEDLFRTALPKYYYYSNGVRQDFNNYEDTQFVSITVVKKFGNIFNKVKNLFESSNSDEKSRL